MAVLASTATKKEIFEHLDASAFSLVDESEFEDMGRIMNIEGDTYNIFAMHTDGDHWKDKVESAITKSGHKFIWL